MIISPEEFGPKKDCDGEAQQELQIIESSSRQRGRLTTINSQKSDNNTNFAMCARWLSDTKTE
jgi:hypothetical protein